MRTTLDLPDDLFRRLKAHAALKGTTLRQLFLTLTERELDASDAPRRPSTLPNGRRRSDFVD